MPQGIDLKKHISILSSDDIKGITQPLKSHFDITYFNYVRLYKNGGRALLTDRADWIEYFYRESLFETKAVVRMEKTKEKEWHLWDEFSGQLSFDVGRSKFDIDNGLTIIQPGKDYTELYYFGTTKKNNQVNQLYLSNIEAFYMFILYFKDKAHALIKKANANKIYLPNEHLSVPEQKHDNNEFKQKIKNFLGDISIKRYYVNEEKEIYLTKREADCLYMLLQNKTAKEIGKKLNLSPRTIEYYLVNIKDKFSVENKSRLIELVTNSRLENDLKLIFSEAGAI